MKPGDLFEVIVTEIEQATPRIKIFRLSYSDTAFSFFPGQWIDLYAPIEGKNIGGYTIISSVSDRGFIDLAIKASEHHPVTKFMHESVKVGDQLHISSGQGKFFLPPEWLNAKKSFTFIAGGIGVTPILSMIRSLKGSNNNILLFYSASFTDDFLFKEELAPFSILTATKESGKRLTLSFLEKHNVDFNSEFYICGPREFIDSLLSELSKAGISKSKLHFEKWW